MNLSLEQYFIFTADKEIDCDASKMFFDRRNKDCVFSAGDAAAIFYSRHCKIYSGDKAVYVEVVSKDDGEYYSINAREAMHNLCLKFNLYPPIILNALKG